MYALCMRTEIMVMEHLSPIAQIQSCQLEVILERTKINIMQMVVLTCPHLSFLHLLSLCHRVHERYITRT
jgi:hypothetical protein